MNNHQFHVKLCFLFTFEIQVQKVTILQIHVQKVTVPKWAVGILVVNIWNSDSASIEAMFK